MKYLFSISMIACMATFASAQNLNQTIDIGAAKIIEIVSDYPSVEIMASEGENVVIEGYVLGNGMPLDDVVEVNWDQSSSTLSFVTDIDMAKKESFRKEPEDLDNLSKEELKKIIKSRRGQNTKSGHNYYDGNWNLETHIVVYLPIGIDKVQADLVYGGLEMEYPARNIDIYNKYGKIEVETTGKLISCDLESTYATVTLVTPDNVATDFRLQSNYGEIFTDVDVEVDRTASTQKAFKTIIVGSQLNGGDRSISMRSDYADVYLRKL